MRKRLIRLIKEIASAFSTNELAFYCLTNSFELPLRDKLAYRLQLQYPKFVVLREWNNVDISIHEKNKVKSLIEIKYSFASMIARRRDKKGVRILKSLKNQYIKSKRTCKDWHGLIFLSCPQSEVPEKYSFQVKKIRAINKYVGEYSSLGSWRRGINEAITLHFPENEFVIISNSVHAGCFFDTNVNFLWFLITRKS